MRVIDVDRRLLDAIVEATHAAGAAAMRHYAKNVDVDIKADDSPVTAADRAAHDTAVAALHRLTPDLAVVSEEDRGERAKPGEWWWLVDPLDGTKEFIRGTAEFTVNVALLHRDAPVAGVVHAPALELTFFAARGLGAFAQQGPGGATPLTPRLDAAPPYRVAVSRDHSGKDERRVIELLGNAPPVPMGSSLKFCAVARGEADFYPRFGPTMEWDTAAAQCVAECAGAFVVDRNGARVTYGKPGLRNGSVFTYADARVFAMALPS